MEPPPPRIPKNYTEYEDWFKSWVAFLKSKGLAKDFEFTEDKNVVLMIKGQRGTGMSYAALKIEREVGTMKISFSHLYDKLPFGAKKAILLAVQIWDVKDLPGDFLDYDTAYTASQNEVGDSITQYYQLPEKGSVLVLFLWANKQLFTTIRRWTPDKERYYRNGIGYEFDLVVE